MYQKHLSNHHWVSKRNGSGGWGISGLLLVRRFDGGELLLPLCETFGKDTLVLCFLGLLVVDTSVLEGAEVAAALESDGGYEALDFRATEEHRGYTHSSVPHGRDALRGGILDIRLGVWLRSFLLLAGDLPSDDKLAHIVLLLEVEEFADLGRTFGAEAFREDSVGEARDLLLALLDDDKGEDSNVGADDAPTDGLAFTLACAARAEARVAVGEQESHTVREKDALLHRETLFIVSTCDAEDVALEFVADRVAGHFLRDPLVVEDTAAPDISNLVWVIL